MSVDRTTSLKRSEPAPPVGIVHLGLGAFSRSHLAWYTAHASDAADWGIAAYTGRSPALADALTAQDGLFTLIERDGTGDHAEVIQSISRARPGDDIPSLITNVSAPTTAVVTLTITEAGYRLDAWGEPDWNDPVVKSDADILRTVFSGQVSLETARPASALGRLLLGLEQRRRHNGEGLTLLSCDNVPDNGGRLKRGLVTWASTLDPAFSSWLGYSVGFASSSVDRITPRLEPAEALRLREEYGDAAPVVAETFTDWVICGRFPAGRPLWETAGARFVDDLQPWENRKLWLLNGAHTLLASLGQLRGHQTVAEAIADEYCRAAVGMLWDEAERHLSADLDSAGYRRSLLSRFANPGVQHQLRQIATDSLLKMQLRVLPVYQRERAAMRSGAGCALAVAAWIVACRAGLHPDLDRHLSVSELVGAISEEMVSDSEFRRQIDRWITELTGMDHGRALEAVSTDDGRAQ